MVVKASIGLRRIPKGTRSSIAGATRNTREQIAVLKDNLEKVIDGIKEATPEAIEDALRPVFELSQVYVPVDTKALKESGYLIVQEGSRKIVAEVGYARGGRPFYAVFVHEMVDLHHAPPTQALFLQKAIQEEGTAKKIEDRIVKSLTRAIGF